MSVTADELVSVLVHEVHHVLFGHLSMQAEDYPMPPRFSSPKR